MLCMVKIQSLRAKPTAASIQGADERTIPPFVTAGPGASGATKVVSTAADISPPASASQAIAGLSMLAHGWALSLRTEWGISGQREGMRRAARAARFALVHLCSGQHLCFTENKTLCILLGLELFM